MCGASLGKLSSTQKSQKWEDDIDDDNAEQGGLGGRGCIILAWQLFGPLATQGFAKIEEQKIKTSI